MRARVAAILLAVAALAAAPAGAAEPWRHGLLEAKADSGFMLMLTQGFAAKQGLALETVQFKNDVAPLQALLAGELDSFEGGPQGVIVAAGRGADLKILGCHFPGLPHGIFVRDTIATPQDLRGKTIAISAPGGFPDVLARALLEKYNIPPEDERFANLGSDLDRFKAVVAGVADAGVSSREFVPMAKAQGVKLLLSARDVLPQYVRTCIMTTGKVIAKRPDALTHFLAAEMQGLAYAVSHRAETIELTQEITHAKPDDPRAAYLYDDAVATRSVDPAVSLPLDKIQWLENLVVKLGQLPQPYDIAKVTDGTFRAKAAQLIAK